MQTVSDAARSRQAAAGAITTPHLAAISAIGAGLPTLRETRRAAAMSEHCEHAWVGDSECAYCEIVRLRDLIRTHNALCENACAARSDAHCEPWLTRGRWCPDCP